MAQQPLTLTPFLAGYFISRIGDALYTFCLPLLSYRLTGSALVMGSLFAVSVLPVILFAPLAGAMLDRFDRRRLMLFTDLARMGLVALVPVLEHFGLLELWCLYALTLLLSLLSTVYDLAVVTIIPRLAGNGLTRANAGVQAAGQLADMIGPAIAGVLVSAFSLTSILWLDVCSFAATLTVLWRLPADSGSRAAASRTGVLAEMAGGLAWLVRAPVQLALSLQAAIGNFGYSAAYATLTYYLITTLQLSGGRIGITYSLLAAGGLAGSLAIVLLERHCRYGRLIPLLLLAGTCGFLLPALSPFWLAPGLGFALVAACNTAWSILAASVRQRSVPPELLGRVLSFSRVLTRTAMPLGALLGGWMTGTLPPGAVFLLAAGAKLAEVAIALASPIRRLGRNGAASASGDRQHQ
ncbi:MFS transporter [Paenibacillus tepidiphilus]|uniref:MFS transporter n=1 Tax=Paenibacillus tepidiphilus TaxID=2608683 RepID=UPI00193E495F|nr:MFS transporter [Paenibacillus tepidiphilus]